MSRKKTSESVDEILRSVREQSTQAARESAASNTQVDDILASLGMGPKVTLPGASGTASFTPVSPTPAASSAQQAPAASNAKAAPRPAAPRQAAPRQARPAAAEKETGPAPSARPARPAAKAPQPSRAPARTASSYKVSTTANLPKTASEVQRYFRKTSPNDELEDPTSLLRQVKEFQNFFGESIAVIPDSEKDKAVLGGPTEQPREEERPKGKRGWGFSRRKRAIVDEDTGEVLIPAELNQPVDPAELLVTPPPTEEPAPQEPLRQQEPPAAEEPQQREQPTQRRQPGVEHQGTIAFPYRRTPRSNRTHIKTIEFEPQPRRRRARTATPDITMHISALRKPAPQRPEKPSRPAWAAPPPDLPAEEPLTPPPDLTGSATLTPPPIEPGTGQVLTDTGAVKLDFVNRIAQSINEEDGFAVGEDAIEAARILQGQQELEDAQPRARKKGFHPFGGHAPDETEQMAAPPFADADAEEEYVDDYNRVEDAPVIRADLQDMVFRLRVRSIIGALVAVLLLVLDITARSGVALVAAIDPATAPQAFLAVNLLLLILTGALNRATLIDGVVSFRGNASTDTVVLFTCIGSLVQLAAFLALPTLYDPQKMTLFAGFTALLICLNAVGKSITGSVVAKNFDLVSNGVDHAAAYPLHDEALLRRLTRGLGERKPSLLVSRPTPLVKGFITNSFSPRQSDRVAQNAAMIVLVAALLATVVNAVVQKNAGMAVSVFAAVLCLGAPLCATFVGAIPEYKMHQSASRVGAIIPGWESIRKIGRTNVVLASVNDLFPAGSASLHGIKTFEKERIDIAIVYAASILVEGCPTLRDVFLSIVQNNRDLLMPVENLTTEVGGGFVGWIQNNRVLVGNRKLMEKYDIELPSLEYEKRFTQGGRKPVYLAVAGKLFGMFLISYAPNAKVKTVVDSLRRAGISLLVSSEDFSVDGALVEDLYGLPQGSVKVLDAQETDDLHPAITWLPESEGCMIHLGSFASFVGGVQAASGAAVGERAASTVMIVSVIINCIIAVALSVNGNIASMALPVLILYQIIWSVATLIFPLAIQKYQ